MSPDSKDMARLWDMLDAARAVVAFTKDLRFDRKTRNAVERNLEIIGEAAMFPHQHADGSAPYRGVP